MVLPSYDPVVEAVSPYIEGYARGYLEDDIVLLQRSLKENCKDLGCSLFSEFLEQVPRSLLIDLFYPGKMFRTPIKSRDLMEMSIPDLLEYQKKLMLHLKLFRFWETKNLNNVPIENSLKTLEFLAKSKKAGSLVMEMRNPTS